MRILYPVTECGGFTLHLTNTVPNGNRSYGMHVAEEQEGGIVRGWSHSEAAMLGITVNTELVWLLNYQIHFNFSPN